MIDPQACQELVNLRKTPITKKQVAKAVRLIVICVILIVFFGGMSYVMHKKRMKKKGKKTSLKKYLLGDTSNMKNFGKRFVVGMGSGLVFGFIDNAGLFMGMDSLEPFIERLSPDKNVQAGIGNTFSDALGAFLAVFIGRMISMGTNIDETPMIGEAVGIVVGCILGFSVFKWVGMAKTCDKETSKVKKFIYDK